MPFTPSYWQFHVRATIPLSSRVPVISGKVGWALLFIMHKRKISMDAMRDANFFVLSRMVH